MSHTLRFNALGLPVGSGSAEFYTELKQLTLSQISIRYSSWRVVPHMEKEILWEDIKTKFPMRDAQKSICMQKAAEAWRRQKSVLRKLLQPSKPFVSWLCAKPESITYDDRYMFCLDESTDEQICSGNYTNSINNPSAPRPLINEGPSSYLLESTDCKILGVGGEVVGYGLRTPTGTMGVVHGHQLDKTEVKVLIMEILDPTYPVWRKTQGGAETLGGIGKADMCIGTSIFLPPVKKSEEVL